MPGDAKPERKKQFNCQPDEETWARAAALKPRIAAAIGLAKVSDAVLLRLALLELEKRYPPEEPARAKKGKPEGRP